MRILYVAKHGSGGNDEEGAISWALEQLGHEVLRVVGKRGRTSITHRADLLLFHKWDDWNMIAALAQRMPVAFWYFDLVRSGETPARDASRIAWMQRAASIATIGFLTDGDWAATNAKLRWLPQAFDSRDSEEVLTIPLQEVLFTGTVIRAGQQREAFAADMHQQYGSQFRHVPRGLHGPALEAAIRSAAVVVAPPWPMTDRYWSNRLYLTLGYGGYLLHPYSAGVADSYSDGAELDLYVDGEDMHSKIAAALADPQRRARIAAAGRERTLREHTYIHRCKQLLKEVARATSV